MLPALAYLSSIRGGCPSPTARNEATIFSFFARSRQTGAVFRCSVAHCSAARATLCFLLPPPPLCLRASALPCLAAGNSELEPRKFSSASDPECRGTAAVFDVDRAQKRNFGLGDHRRRQPESESQGAKGHCGHAVTAKGQNFLWASQGRERGKDRPPQPLAQAKGLKGALISAVALMSAEQQATATVTEVSNGVIRLRQIF